MKNPFKLFQKWVAIRYVEKMKRKFQDEQNKVWQNEMAYFKFTKMISVCDKMLTQLRKS